MLRQAMLMTLLSGSVRLLVAFYLVLSPECVGGCLTERFTCTQGLCVPEDCVCDFTDNCGDGSDEENCESSRRINIITNLNYIKSM